MKSPIGLNRTVSAEFSVLLEFLLMFQPRQPSRTYSDRALPPHINPLDIPNCQPSAMNARQATDPRSRPVPSQLELEEGHHPQKKDRGLRTQPLISNQTATPLPSPRRSDISAISTTTQAGKRAPSLDERLDFSPWSRHFRPSNNPLNTRPIDFGVHPLFVGIAGEKCILGTSQEAILENDENAVIRSIHQLEESELGALGLERVYRWNVNSEMKQSFSFNQRCLSLAPRR